MAISPEEARDQKRLEQPPWDYCRRLAQEMKAFPRKHRLAEFRAEVVVEQTQMLSAALDPRLKHITIDHTLESYTSLLQSPMPIDAPEDILPGVLLHYDVPDLIHTLGSRLTFTTRSPAPPTFKR